jgi:hypothetical protein
MAVCFNCFAKKPLLAPTCQACTRPTPLLAQVGFSVGSTLLTVVFIWFSIKAVARMLF